MARLRRITARSAELFLFAQEACRMSLSLSGRIIVWATGAALPVWPGFEDALGLKRSPPKLLPVLVMLYCSHVIRFS